MAALTLQGARRVIVKIGSALLVGNGGVRQAWLRALAEDIASLRAQGSEIVIVSSGSIALGRSVLALEGDVAGGGGLALEQSQAAAAVGQIQLARAYEDALAPHAITAAQVLVTLEDTQDRRRYLNIRATLSVLLGMGCVPIVNENDTVATDEIRYGDNDRLAAQVAVTIGADRLVLLSDVDGLYTANPHIDPAARHLPEVAAITPEIAAMAGDAVSGLSRGGMKTKLMAARIATAGGCAMVLAAGMPLHPLRALAEGARCTWFAPQDDPQVARKRWISAMKPRGALRVDAGAVAPMHAGKSLLPAGVTAVTGHFGRGDPVAIEGPDGVVLGQGLVRYTADEVRVIRGQHSARIAPILGYPGRAALIHRDDMVLQGGGT